MPEDKFSHSSVDLSLHDNLGLELLFVSETQDALCNFFLFGSSRICPGTNM